MDWLNETALRHLKNYQIWHHRQFVLDRIGSPAGETDFIGRMFEQDAKNYHVWSYRQWLVRRFGLWEEGELEETERLLEKDVRNNSAWNHRFFVVNGRDAEGVEEAVGVAAGVKDDQILKRELRYAMKYLMGSGLLTCRSQLRRTSCSQGTSKPEPVALLAGHAGPGWQTIVHCQGVCWRVCITG